MYVTLNHWFVESFNDANSVIQLNDKEEGVIIGKGYLSDIAGHLGGMNAYNVSVHPMIIEASRGGFKAALSNTRPSISTEKWPLETCYPFIEKDEHKAKKTSSKALVMTHAYSNVIMDKIEEAVKNGLAGNESDNGK